MSAKTQNTEIYVPPTLLALVVMLLAPVLMFEYLPLMDVTNHLARHHIADINRSPETASVYYQYIFHAFGNASVDIIREVTGHRLSPENLSRLAAGLYLALFPISLLVLHKAIWGNWSVWPLVATPFAFNANFLLGFENYTFCIPFVILSLAAYIVYESKHFVWRFTLVSILASALGFMHILGTAAFGLLLACHLLGQSIAAGRFISVFRHAALAIPFLALGAMHHSLNFKPDNPFGILHGYSAISHFQQIPLSLVTRHTGDFISDILNLTFTGVAAAITIASFFAFVIFILRSKLEMLFRPGYGIAIMVFFYIVLLVPDNLIGVALTEIRYPVFLAMLMIAACNMPKILQNRIWAVICIAITLTALQSLSLYRVSKTFNAEISDYKSVMEQLPNQATLLPLRKQSDVYLNWPVGAVSRHHHTPSLAAIEQNALVPILFVDIHGLDFRSNWRKQLPYRTYTPIDIDRLSINPETNEWEFEQNLSAENRFVNDPSIATSELEMMYSYSIIHTRNWKSVYSHVLFVSEGESGQKLIDAGLIKIASKGLFSLYFNPQADLSQANNW